jgi:hypothetical protein
MSSRERERERREEGRERRERTELADDVSPEEASRSKNGSGMASVG